MADQPTRVCTLCQTRFAPHTARGLGCGVYFVVFVGVVALDAGLRPGPLVSLGVGLAAAIVAGWVLQRVGASRERTCTACGSQQTVPLDSPVAAAAEPPAPRFDPLTGVPVAPPTSVRQAPPQSDRGPVVITVVLLALAAAYWAYRCLG